MYFKFIDNKLVEDRVDAQFFTPEYLESLKKIKQFKIEKLENISKKIFDPPHIAPEFVGKSDFEMIMIENIGSDGIKGDFRMISETCHKDTFKNSHMEGDELLVSRVGNSSGTFATVFPRYRDKNVSGNISIIKLKNGVIDKEYAFAYFNSNIGQDSIKREITNTARKFLTISKIKEFKIPIPSPEIQKYIGDKVRKVEELRGEAKILKKEADKILNIEILGVDKQGTIEERGKWVKKDDIFTERLEPEYYANRYLYAEKIIKKQEYRTLGDIIEEIQDGPGGWSISTNDYVNDGVPIVRGVNIGNDGEFINKGFVYITTEKNKELKKTEVRPGQVLLTVRGTIGRATVMPDYIEKTNLNAAVVRIKVKEDIVDPYYLAGFFNSSIGRLQTSRIANGAVQLNMNLSECRTNLIPIPSMGIQQKYRMKFLEYLNVKRISKQLIQEAKQDVEDLIEGNFDMSKLN